MCIIKSRIILIKGYDLIFSIEVSWITEISLFVYHHFFKDNSFMSRTFDLYECNITFDIRLSWTSTPVQWIMWIMTDMEICPGDLSYGRMVLWSYGRMLVLSPSEIACGQSSIGHAVRLLWQIFLEDRNESTGRIWKQSK
jgi:hypothetical protein